MSPESLLHRAAELHYDESVRRRGCDERQYLFGPPRRRLKALLLMLFAVSGMVTCLVLRLVWLAAAIWRQRF